MGKRITRSFVEAERRSLPTAEFVRERLCWWEDPVAGASGIPDELWLPLVDRASKVESVGAFAVDVTPDQSWASLAVAGARRDGLAHVEVVAHQRGTAWIAEWFSERTDKYPGVPVALDGAGPAGFLEPEIVSAGREVVKSSGREMAQACGGLFDALLRGSVRHLSQPVLDGAVSVSSRRTLGDAWAWSRKSSTGDISPLVAITLAHWLAGHGGAPESVYESRGLVEL